MGSGLGAEGEEGRVGEGKDSNSELHLPHTSTLGSATRNQPNKAPGQCLTERISLSPGCCKT